MDNDNKNTTAPATTPAAGRRIVVCGPPHSGKSVFVEQLRALLMATGALGVLEGCPDGEGGWAGSAAQELVGGLRRKGKFTDGFVGWVIESIRGAKQPLTLIDVGGVRSPENERIFHECDGFIVLANPAKFAADGRPELEAWREFGEAMGCKPVALLSSELHGESRLDPDQGDGVIRGVQAGLERGTRAGGPVLAALAKRLVELAGVTVALGELEATIHTGRLADRCEIPAEARQNARLGFRPQHAPEAMRACEEAVVNRGLPVRLWGACPGWLAALVAGAAPACELWDIRLGWREVPDLALVAGGSQHLAWRVTETDDHTVVAFQIPGQVFDPARLGEVAVPTVTPGKPVVLSGRGPHWLTAAVARAYARLGWHVAVLAPNESAEPTANGMPWGQANPGLAPAVVVAGRHVGEILGVPVDAVK